MTVFNMRAIGYIRSAYEDTGQIPKGLGAKHSEVGILELLPEFEEGLREIEGFSHLFVLWVFHEAGACELVGHTPTDGKVHGIFATRAPRRPNPIGLSVVRLLRREGRRLHLGGIDMLDGTPVLDIKPYMSGVPPGELRRGWLDEAEAAKAESPCE